MVCCLGLGDHARGVGLQAVNRCQDSTQDFVFGSATRGKRMVIVAEAGARKHYVSDKW